MPFQERPLSYHCPNSMVCSYWHLCWDVLPCNSRLSSFMATSGWSMTQARNLASCHGYHRKCRNRYNSCSSYHSRLNKRHKRQTIWMCREFWHGFDSWCLLMSPFSNICRCLSHSYPFCFPAIAGPSWELMPLALLDPWTPPRSRVVVPAALAKLLMISRLGFGY